MDNLDIKIDERIHAELLALQNLAAADIAFYKQQQWQATNYILLLYAAIVAAGKLVIAPLSDSELGALWLIALVVFLSGLYVIHDLNNSLSRSRDLLPAARKYFNKDISLSAYACGGDPENALIKSSDKPSLNKLFQLVLVVGFVLTTWVLVRL